MHPARGCCYATKKRRSPWDWRRFFLMFGERAVARTQKTSQICQPMLR
jgi:hypothetical protein